MNRWRPVRVAMVLSVGILAHATALEAQDAYGTARIELDNDYFLFALPPLERPDHDYTHGTRVSWSMRTPSFVRSSRLCVRSRDCRVGVEIGQHLYTPRVEGDSPVPGQRPFAGWLFGSATISSHGPGPRYRDIMLTLGFTGPASLAKESQLWMHEMIPAFRRPVGWNNQLSNELAFGLAASQGWRVPLMRHGAFELIGTPEVSAGVGTLRSFAGASARAEAGFNLSREHKARSDGTFSVMAFAEAGGELLFNSLFLNGNTFHRSVRVDPSHTLGRWTRGVSVRVGPLSIEHSITTRTRTYEAAEPTHSYGTIAMAWSWRS